MEKQQVKTQLNVRLSPEFKREIDVFAAQNGFNLKDLVEKALKYYMVDQK
jgi:predicted HicB family RNase H-like nuclease